MLTGLCDRQLVLAMTPSGHDPPLPPLTRVTAILSRSCRRASVPFGSLLSLPMVSSAHAGVGGTAAFPHLAGLHGWTSANSRPLWAKPEGWVIAVDGGSPESRRFHRWR